jgi:hypothetical protein
MPITSVALKQLRKVCTFEYAGESVTVEYYPAAVGADMLATANKLIEQINAAQAANDEAAANTALLDTGTWLCGIIAKWDYMEDDGVTMQPITPENMAAQMMQFTDFMASIMVAIMNHRTQGNANGTSSSVPSAATSSPTDNSASTRESPTISASSSSPDGSTELQVSNG